MSRAAVLALLIVLLTASPAVADDPPHAYHRLDRVAAALARDPLFVDPDLAVALDEPARGQVRAAVKSASRRIGTPVYAVVIPNPIDSESQGRDGAFLFELHERSRRDGLYVMVNSYGSMESEAFGVPRDYDEYQPDDWRPADRERPFDGLANRIAKRVDAYVAAPSASPTMPRLYSSPDPFGEEDELRPREAETKEPFLTGLILVGPVSAGLLYGAGTGVVALRRRARRSKTRPWKPDSPSLRELRSHAATELDELRGMLADNDGKHGLAYAASAYDAAQILHDDAGDDEDRAIDLVGAIVLARRGRAALVRGTAGLPAPCLVNPLHGDSAARRKLKAADVDRVLPTPAPVCGACRDVHSRGGLKERHLLRVPGPDGPRRHTAIPGVWRDTAWGARDKNLLPRVMRYLGVD